MTTGGTRMVALIDLYVPDEVIATNDDEAIKQGVQDAIGVTGARVISLGAESEPESVLRRAHDLAHIRRLVDGIHAAVSFTYIEGEKARLQARMTLKLAAGWPLTDGEEGRLARLEREESDGV